MYLIRELSGYHVRRKAESGHCYYAVTNKPANKLIELLKDAGFMFTRLEARGGEGPVEIIFMIVKRKRLEEALRIIESFDADAFYSIYDVKYSSAQQEKEIAIPMHSYNGFNRLPRVRLGT